MTIRIGIIGCGFITQLHSRALKGIIKAGLVDAAVVATHDVDRDRATACAVAHGAELVADDVPTLLAAVDTVWICTPTSSHRALVEQAAAAGVAIFCEKPLATTLADAEAMAAAASAVPSQVGLVLRTSPVYGALVDLVRSGDLGRPMAVVFRDDQYLPNQGQYASEWRADVTIAGGGTLLEHSIHDLDVLRWLLGDVTSVSARTANFAGHPGIEDLAVATLQFESGAVATLTSAWHQILSRPSTRSLEVICERGIAAVPENEYEGPLHLVADGGNDERRVEPPQWVRDLPIEEPWLRYAGTYAPQALSFLTALAEGRTPEPGLDVAVAAHRLADAVYRSAALDGAPVTP
ncbi:MAG TPA: Gfo/Idh/MocA family oxidoreductase [Acidimicrobiales bacterium]|nr:Gfo/Idh/MocA family oxidoreductase [Acidimicrobiales bacterium]